MGTIDTSECDLANTYMTTMTLITLDPDVYNAVVLVANDKASCVKMMKNRCAWI